MAPSLIVVAGANGAGKSTYTAPLRRDGIAVVDPDAFGRALNPADPRAARVSAGRDAIVAERAHLEAGESFAVETTLAGRSTLRLMEEAESRGYRVTLVYIGTENVGINLRRIRERVLLGGHDVPESDVRRRYTRSLANVEGAMARAHDVLLVDNSSDTGHVLVALSENERLVSVRPVPGWMMRLGLDDGVEPPRMGI